MQPGSVLALACYGLRPLGLACFLPQRLTSREQRVQEHAELHKT